MSGGKVMYKILENNVNEIISQLLVGYKHSDYTRECVNSQKVARYVAYEQTVNKLISDTYEAGYCPHAICGPAEKIAEVDLKIIPYKHLKQSADEHFELFIAKQPVDIGRSYIEASDVMKKMGWSI